MRMIVAPFVVGMLAVMPGAEPARADATTDALAAASAADARHDYVTEFTLLRPLAERGNARAQHALGDMYRAGQGVSQDDTEAFRWFGKAAEQEYSPSQYDLGLMYLNGQGVTQDNARAIDLFRKAAERGVAQAQFNLGLIYAKAQGVTQDNAEGLRWLRLAAAQGFAPAQISLGLMYVTGQGVTQDYVEAYMWFDLATASGDNGAIKDRERVEHLMTAEQMVNAKRQSASWQQAAADNATECRKAREGRMVPPDAPPSPPGLGDAAISKLPTDELFRLASGYYCDRLDNFPVMYTYGHDPAQITVVGTGYERKFDLRDMDKALEAYRMLLIRRGYPAPVK